MNKVLMAIDGNHFSEGAFNFILDLNRRQPLVVTGIFLSSSDYAELLYSVGGIALPVVVPQQELDHDFSEMKQRFIAACHDNGISYIVHDDKESRSVNALIGESRFADLLVIGSEMFYENLGIDTQNDYIEKLLHRSECPVILVPEQFNIPETTILALDGSPSCVYAMKQFCYLFPHMATAKTLLVNAGKDTRIFNDMMLVEEYATCHFKDHTFKKVDGNPRKYFNTWISECGNTFLVTGAYGRSLFSEMLHKSFITETLRDHKFPIFISHP